jgi:hypothetical protein
MRGPIVLCKTYSVLLYGLLTRYPQEKHIHKAMMYYDVLFYGTEIIYIPRVDHKPVGPFPPNWARARVIRDRMVHVVEFITTYAFSTYHH